MSKTLLEVGDRLKRWEVVREVGVIYKITSITKTLAKTDDGRTFYRDLNYDTSKPMENYLAEVRCKELTSLGKRYFLIKEDE